MIVFVRGRGLYLLTMTSSKIQPLPLSCLVTIITADCCSLTMASLELSEKRPRSADYLTPPVPAIRKHVGARRTIWTPPPDYNDFLSDNDLPSARQQLATSYLKSNGSTPKSGSFNFTRVS